MNTRIRNFDDARSIVEGTLVGIEFEVNFGGEQKATFTNRGILYRINQDSVELVTEVVGPGHPPIGVSTYMWSSGHNKFRCNPVTSFDIPGMEVGTPLYRDYATRLGVQT